MASRQQLIKLIMQHLGVWQAGQDLPAEDYQAINERLPYVLLAMTRAKVYDHTDPDNIPDEALEDMAAYLTQHFVTTFGLTGEERATVTEMAGGAERALRFQRVLEATRAPVQSEFF